MGTQVLARRRHGFWAWRRHAVAAWIFVVLGTVFTLDKGHSGAFVFVPSRFSNAVELLTVQKESAQAADLMAQRTSSDSLPNTPIAATSNPTETTRLRFSRTSQSEQAGKSLLVATAGVVAISAFGFGLFEIFRRALSAPNKQHHPIPSNGGDDFASSYPLERGTRDFAPGSGVPVFYHSPNVNDMNAEGENVTAAGISEVELHGTSFEALPRRIGATLIESDDDAHQFADGHEISMATAPIAVDNESAERFQAEHELI